MAHPGRSTAVDTPLKLLREKCLDGLLVKILRVITKPTGSPGVPAEPSLMEDTPLSSFHTFIYPDPILRHILMDHHFPVFSIFLLFVCFKVKK